MKSIATFAVAVALALSLTACGGTTMATDTGRMTEEARGNVSTTDDGTVNGTNRHDQSRQNRQNHPTTQTAPGTMNTNAMGAGNRN